MKRISTKPEYKVADVDYSSVSVKQLKSGKGLLIAIAVLAAITDLIAFTVLTLKGFAGWQYSVLPLLLFVADVILIGLAIGGNFRMKYTRKAIFIYIVVTAGLVGAICVLGTIPFTVMSITAIVALCLTHFVFWWVSAYGARYARRPIALRKSTSAAFVLLLTFGISALFMGYNAVLGYYGQGKVYPNYERTVVYKMESDGSYTAKDVLPGQDGAVIIPEKFNGKEVRKVDLKILTYDSVTSVTLVGLWEKEFVNPSQYPTIREDIPVLVSREVIDEYRGSALRYALVNDIRADVLCNAFEPNDLGENEVSLSFSYRRDKLFTTAVNNILPVMIFEKGERFNESLLSAYSNFVKYNDTSSQTDLKWNFDNNDKYIMTPLVREDGTGLVGSSITENMKVDIRFEKIFRLQMTVGNDERFTTTGKVGEPFYTVSDQAEFTPITRPGFTADWKARFPSTREEAALSSNYSINNFLRDFGKTGGNDIELIPSWRVITPVFESVYSDLYGQISTGNNFAFTYGENPVLTGETKAHDLPLIFRLYRKSTLIHTVESADATANFALLNYLPSDSDSYRMTVEVDLRNVNTMLVSPVVERALPVTVDKKELTLTWTVPSSQLLVYDGEEKMVTCIFDLSQSVNGDVFDHTVEGSLAVNAGQYEAVVTLSGQTNERYRIKVGQDRQSYEVAKRGVAAEWTENAFIYNGLEQRPNAVAYGVEKDGQLTIVFTGAEIHAGENYTVKGALADTNYALLNPEKEFAIGKRPIGVLWTDGEAFVYNGQAQKPSVAEVQNAVADDMDKLLASLVYSAWNGFVKAGDYAVTIQFTGQEDYEIATGGVQNYRIEKRELTPQFSTEPLVYDGEQHTATIETLDGIVSGEEQTVRKTFVYSQYGVNVGTYSVDVTLPDDSNYRLGQMTSTTFEITKRDLYVQVMSEEKTYDNTPYTSYQAAVNNLATTDTLAEVGEEVWSGTGINALDASWDYYTLKVELTVGEKHGNYAINYVDGTLQIVKRALQVTVSGGEKVYDGQVFVYNDFTLRYDNLADGENLAEWTVTYVGSGVGAVNASDTPYSVTAELSGVSLLNNYATSITNGQVKINKRILTPIWVNTPIDKVEKVYDGTTVCGTEFVYGEYITLANADIGTEITGVKFTAEFDYPDVRRNQFVTVTFGALQTGAGFNPQNYTYDSSQTLQFASSITPRPLAVTKKAEGNFAKTYDGTGTFDKNLLLDGTHFSVENAVQNEAITANFTAFYDADNVTATKVLVTFADLVGNTLFNADNYTYQTGTVLEYTASITQRALTLQADDKSKVYDNKIFGGAFAFSATGLADGDLMESVASVAFEGSALTGINVTDLGYEIVLKTVTEGEKFANYDITYRSGRLTITKRALNVQAVGKVKTYDGNVADGFTVQTKNLADGDILADVGAIAYRGEGTTNPNRTDMGYTITPYFATDGSKHGNYHVTFASGMVVINPRQISLLKTTEGNFTKVYDGTTNSDANVVMDTHFTVDNAVSGEITNVVYTATYNSKDVRDATIITLKFQSFEGAKYQPDNYTFDVNSSLQYSATITPREIWGDRIDTAPIPSKVYDGTTEFQSLYNKNIHYTVANGVGTEIFELSYAAQADSVSAGTRDVTVNFTEIVAGSGFLSDNYTLKGDNSIVLQGEIIPKALVITSDNQQKVYDRQPYSGFTVTAKGLVDGDALADVLTVTFGVEILKAKDVVLDGHTIDFTVDGQAKYGNYAVTNVYGKLTITPKEVTLSSDNQQKTYDGQPYPSFSVTAIGLVDGDTTIGDLALWGWAFSETIRNATDVVKDGHTIDFTTKPWGESKNYTIKTVFGKLTILPRPIQFEVVEGAKLTKEYDGTVNYNGDIVHGTHYRIIGGVEGEIDGAIISSAKYNSPNVADANSVEVRFGALTGSAKADNYSYSTTTLQFSGEITPREVETTWSKVQSTAKGDAYGYMPDVVYDDAFYYTGLTQAPQATATGVQGESIPLQVTGGGINAQKTPYTAQATMSVSDGNYRLTNPECEFMIVPKKVRPIWSNLAWIAEREIWGYNYLPYTDNVPFPVVMQEQTFINGTEQMTLNIPQEAFDAVTSYRHSNHGPAGVYVYVVEFFYNEGNYEFTETRLTYRLVASVE